MTPPAAIFVIFSLVTAYVLDEQTRVSRAWFMIIPTLFTIGAFIGMTVTENKPALYVCVMIASAAFAATSAGVSPWRAQTVQGSTYAAFAFGMQNSIGQLANIFGAQIFRAQYAPRYTVPFIVCICFLTASIGMICVIWWFSYGSEKAVRHDARTRRQQASMIDRIAVVGAI